MDTKPKQSKNLFSDHFLDNRLCNLPEWEEECAAVFIQLANLMNKAKLNGSSWNEAQTETEFIQPVLNLLGWKFIPQVKAGRRTRPDYALFLDEKTKDDAYPHQGNDTAFYSRATVIAEAKYWSRPLSHKDTGNWEPWDKSNNPSYQIVSYLDGAKVEWGILTNGCNWRLYSRDVSSTASEFYEVDLRDVFDFYVEGNEPSTSQLEQFKHWWLFFRRDAFAQFDTQKTFIHRALEDSTSYAREISNKLKELVFKEVMPVITGGFIAYRYQELDIKTENDESLSEIYKASLHLLYKLLFILYAEARVLLPMDNQDYRENSLDSIAKWAAQQLDAKRPISNTTYASEKYERLKALFIRIDRGDPSLGIPHYNGGLFSPGSTENNFLDLHKLSDLAVAKAIDVLVRDEGSPVDYAYISVRNLGSIYEGLLENKLKVIDAAIGKVELINDKGERKATGSYYTPDYIVEYIIKNTLGPVLEEKQKDYVDAMGKVNTLRLKLEKTVNSATNRLLRQELEEAERHAREAFLGIKVLDPAMGSGHFLVNAVDFLTDGIIQKMQYYHDSHPETKWEWDPIQQLLERIRTEIIEEMKVQGLNIDTRRLEDTALLTRLVMKRCIYGVDLNPMAVELAKVSLWLHSFTVGAPLSFLDHHLRCGNSLIGVWEIEKSILPGTERWNEIVRTLSSMVQISNMTDSTLGEVAQSSALYKESRTWILPTIERFNAELASHFLGWGKVAKTVGQVSKMAYQTEEDRLGLPGLHKKYKLAQHYGEDKRFFHWKLEFPEIFIDSLGIGWSKNSGFDAVVGNPPYVDIAPDAFFSKNYSCSTSRNLYSYFVERSVVVLSDKGRVGQIVPLSLACSDRMEILRSWLKQETTDIDVAHFGIRPSKIFQNVDQRVTIIRARKKAKEEPTRLMSTRFHHWNPGQEIEMIKSLSYLEITSVDQKLGWPKLGDDIGREILKKIFFHQGSIKDYYGNTWTCYYHGIGRYWLKAYDFIPTYLKSNGQPSRSSTLFDLSFQSEEVGRLVLGLLNSSLFYWFWVLYGDDFHLTRTLIENFPFQYSNVGLKKIYNEIEFNAKVLMESYQENSIMKRNNYAAGAITLQEFYPRKSKEIINKIDDLFGMIYGLTKEEMVYIKNYDMKFRNDDDVSSEGE